MEKSVPGQCRLQLGFSYFFFMAQQKKENISVFWLPIIYCFPLASFLIFPFLINELGRVVVFPYLFPFWKLLPHRIFRDECAREKARSHFLWNNWIKKRSWAFFFLSAQGNHLISSNFQWTGRKGKNKKVGFVILQRFPPAVWLLLCSLSYAGCAHVAPWKKKWSIIFLECVHPTLYYYIYFCASSGETLWLYPKWQVSFSVDVDSCLLAFRMPSVFFFILVNKSIHSHSDYYDVTKVRIVPFLGEKYLLVLFIKNRRYLYNFFVGVVRIEFYRKISHVS